MIVIVQTAVQ